MADNKTPEPRPMDVGALIDNMGSTMVYRLKEDGSRTPGFLVADEAGTVRFREGWPQIFKPVTEEDRRAD